MNYINDLEELEDILHCLELEEDLFMSEMEAIELTETVFCLIDDLIRDHPEMPSEPHFKEHVLDEILMVMDLDEDDEFEAMVEDIIQLYIHSYYPSLEVTESESDSESVDVSNEDEDEESVDEETVIERKIQHLKSIPQPVQRTPEWYQFRWNLITASNAWKAFGTQCSINQLIYEKCKPIEIMEPSPVPTAVNTNTTLHWGQKYEPLSVMLYEYLYDSKVDDFGCIQHPKYPFIGASPDGIVVSSNTGRYGNMLEIKNIVNREITGIPKKEYWIQMQLQMEVCDLDKCDFLETKFEEYDRYSDYAQDAVTQHKGVIIQFDKDGIPHYEYMPFGLTQEEKQQWEETTVDRCNETMVFIRYIYWKLAIMSCVLVLRDRLWFKNHVSQMQHVWNIIEQERASGNYEHRAPTKRIKKEIVANTYTGDKNDQCFLKIVKQT